MCPLCPLRENGSDLADCRDGRKRTLTKKRTLKAPNRVSNRWILMRLGAPESAKRTGGHMAAHQI